MHRICQSLHEAGYEVELVGRGRRNSKALHYKVYQQKRLSLVFERGVLFYLEYNVRLFFYLLTRSSSAVNYAVDLDTILAVRWASFFRRVPFIFDAHELFIEVPELMASKTKQSIWKLVGKLCVPKAFYRFTVNRSLQERLGERYACEFVVLRNLPNRKKLIKQEVGAPYLYYQGVLNAGRGLEEAIHAMEQLPALHLRIAGGGDIEDKLRALALKSKAADRIHFEGWLDVEQMHEMASNAYLGFNLLDPHSGNYYYSLANKTFDYIQAELPALHMDFPEYASINNTYEIAMLLKELSAEEIVKKVSFIQTNKEAYLTMKAACRDAKKIYCWENECMVLLDGVEGIRPKTS